MSPLKRNRWFALAGAITLVYAVVSFTVPHGYALTSLVDLGYCLLTVSVGLVMLGNGASVTGPQRRFWQLMGIGYLLQASNPVGWVVYEVVLHKRVPDPWFMDLFLFLHWIPMIAAVGLRPHRSEEEPEFRAGTLDFMLLLAWWVFLYAFVVFPSQYIAVNVPLYDRNYAALYLAENAAVVLVMGIVARGATPGWKRLYLNLMGASALYAVVAQVINLTITSGTYYTGSLNDVALIGVASWVLATALSSREWQLEPTQPRPAGKWGATTLRLAMVAILSLPVLGMWTFLWDHSPASARSFRLFTVLTAMVVLGLVVFMRQFLQDRALIHLLADSRRGFEKEQRLQSHLVQREKLAALGQLIAGAAHEIDHPLTAIMEYSEKLWSNERLNAEQDALVRKIVNQSQRTRELISNLLSFAQQSSNEKQMVDLCMLLQRSIQMRELQRQDQKIRIETAIEPGLPRIWGDGHQLFQAFVQIVENALDALEESGGGLLRVSAQRHGEEVVLQFSDSGPGIREPHRVFDPFYTTKAIGKGTGLGLSAVYGVVQDHCGQIACQNKPEGGAMFVLRLPVGKQADPQALAATHS